MLFIADIIFQDTMSVLIQTGAGYGVCPSVTVSPIQSRCLKGRGGDFIREQRPQKELGLTSPGSAMSPVKAFVTGRNLFANTSPAQPGFSPSFEEYQMSFMAVGHFSRITGAVPDITAAAFLSQSSGTAVFPLGV